MKSLLKAIFPLTKEDKGVGGIICEDNDFFYADNEYIEKAIRDGTIELVGWQREEGELIGRYHFVNLLDFLEDIDYDF